VGCPPSHPDDLGNERGQGLLRAMSLGLEIGLAIVETARRHQPDGLLLNSPRPDLLRFMSALNVEADDIDHMLAILEAVISGNRI